MKYLNTFRYKIYNNRGYFSVAILNIYVIFYFIVTNEYIRLGCLKTGYNIISEHTISQNEDCNIGKKGCISASLVLFEILNALNVPENSFLNYCLESILKHESYCLGLSWNFSVLVSSWSISGPNVSVLVSVSWPSVSVLVLKVIVLVLVLTPTVLVPSLEKADFWT